MTKANSVSAKRILCLVLCFVMLLGLFPSTSMAFASETDADEGAIIIVPRDDGGEDDIPPEEPQPEQEQEQPQGDGENNANADNENTEEEEIEEIDLTDSSVSVVEETLILESSEAVDDDNNSAEEEEPQTLSAVVIQGPASENVKMARFAMIQMSDLEKDDRDEASDGLFPDLKGVQMRNITRNEETVPSSADGSSIDSISAKWLEHDDGNTGIASISTASDSVVSARLQISYALSGSHDYAPGDIVITVPAHIFENRDGSAGDLIQVPYAEDPSRANDYNWRLVDGNYILTNTKRMSAATKGFIQFGVTNIVPHKIVDNELSDDFAATIEVTTEAGNTIALQSNALNMRVDTDVTLQSVTKRIQPGGIVRVKPEDVPAEFLVNGETFYVKATWYIQHMISANTAYTIDYVDTLSDSYSGKIANATTANYREKSGTVVTTANNIYGNSRTGSYVNIITYYPGSQFNAGETYTFTNSATLTLHEVDDPTNVQVKSYDASTDWAWYDPEFEIPNGSFTLRYNGNDNTEYGSGSLTHYSSNRNNYSDVGLTTNGYFGYYGTALNSIRADHDIIVAYTMNAGARQLPWTFVTDGSANADRKLSNYGQRSVKSVSEIDGLSLTGLGELQLGRDYEYVGLNVSSYKPTIYKAKLNNVDGNGDWIDTFQNGSLGYLEDTDASHIPDIHVEIKQNDAWVPFATVQWSSGSLSISLESGGTQTAAIIDLPSDTQGVRTWVDTAIAGFSYDVRPIYKVKSNMITKGLVNGLFNFSTAPWVSLTSNASASVTYSDTGDTIIDMDSSANDTLAGYSTDLSVVASKSSTQTISDVNYDRRFVTIHYSAKVEERSVIGTRQTYERAIADEAIVAETSGVWYDLLPKGMTPVISTVKLRGADSVTSIDTYENYNGSGRTLLIVRANLKNTPKEYTSGNFSYYEDAPTISFDAIYGFEAIKDYGGTIHNVVAFQSGNSALGNVSGFMGEPDDPSVGNNAASAAAFADTEERLLMTDLDPNCSDPVFVYAGNLTTIDILSAARTSLTLDVQVNNDGFWDDGTVNDMDVYMGGQYQYRLRMMSDDGTISKDMILYDSLENYAPTNDDSPEDAASQTWKGTFLGVDVSQLEAAGCAPVVYYSTVDNLQITSTGTQATPVASNIDLTNSSVWTKAEDFTQPLSSVKAIAVDTRKKTDDSDFSLAPLESAVVMINMLAPSGTTAEALIENDAHAFNNACLQCTSIDASIGIGGSSDFIRKNYTKVGITAMDITFDAVWEDDDNRDGIRPETATISLLRDGTDMGSPATASEQNDWEGEFDYLPYADASGNKYHYMLQENAIPGYTTSISVDGNHYTFKNVHIPEKITIEGAKLWEGDTSSDRPSAVRVNLMNGDKIVATQAIRQKANGDWTYSFTNLYKYENGTEIAYSVAEEVTSGTANYIASVGLDGRTITNTFHPYGDVIVNNVVENATTAAQNVQFPFEFVFTNDDENESPVFDSFSYTIYDTETEAVISTGTISTLDGVVSLRGGESIRIEELPVGVKVSATETVMPGFTADKENDSETILPNQAVEMTFRNVYASELRLNLAAQKTLMNKVLKNYQFKFELKDADTGEVIRTAFSGKPSSQDLLVSGNNKYSQADVLFGAVKYTDADDGQTFHYIVTETSTNKAGYTYDDAVWGVTVAVVDNGDGTLTATPTYATGTLTNADAIAADPSVAPVYSWTPAAGISFTNTYSATGQIGLKAWKQINGRNLTAGEFTFELLDVNGQVLQTKTNTASGEINWDPISFTYADILNGGVKKYFVREVRGNDNTVIYTDVMYEYVVTLSDVGDGTMNISQNFYLATNAFDECWNCEGAGYIYGGTCEYCHGAGILLKSNWTEPQESTLPVFTNSLKPGSLMIQKIIENPNSGFDPRQLFQFRVELSSPTGDPISPNISNVAAHKIRDGSVGYVEVESVPEGDEGYEFAMTMDYDGSNGIEEKMITAVPDAALAGDWDGLRFSKLVDFEVDDDGELILPNGIEEEDVLWKRYTVENDMYNEGIGWMSRVNYFLNDDSGRLLTYDFYEGDYFGVTEENAEIPDDDDYNSPQDHTRVFGLEDETGDGSYGLYQAIRTEWYSYLNVGVNYNEELGDYEDYEGVEVYIPLSIGYVCVGDRIELRSVFHINDSESAQDAFATYGENAVMDAIRNEVMYSMSNVVFVMPGQNARDAASPVHFYMRAEDAEASGATVIDIPQP